MLVNFFLELRNGGVPVTVTELLTLLEALRAGVASGSAQEFCYLARMTLVKDERHYDRFDRVFAQIFDGAQKLFDEIAANIPDEWLQALAARTLTEEEKSKVAALGGWEKLLDTLRKRLEEQKERHQGGNKWIGTQGTSPFGAYGYNPEGIRIGQAESRNRRAVKVWDQREYRNFDDTVELGTRNMKLALRKLRKFAREGAQDQLDLDGTIAATARNAGLLDLKLVAERRNAVKVLLFLDVGGSMDDHVRICEELFSAARSEFKHLAYFYFHNFLYENVWQDNRRRFSAVTPVSQILRTYGHDYRVIFVGDATMSPYEITQPGGSVEHWNQEAGSVWMARMTTAYPRLVWLNPEKPERWEYTASVRITRELVDDRMFPVTMQGLDSAITALRHPLGRGRPGSQTGGEPSPGHDRPPVY